MTVLYAELPVKPGLLWYSDANMEMVYANDGRKGKETRRKERKEGTKHLASLLRDLIIHVNLTR